MDRRVWKRRNLFLLLQLGFLEEKKKIFVNLTNLWMWILTSYMKNICCNTEHLSRITCEFLLFVQKYSIHKTFIEAMDIFYPSISKVKFYYHQITTANVYRAPNQTFQDIWKSKGTYFMMMHRE